MADENVCSKCGKALSYAPDSNNPCCDHCGEMILGTQVKSAGKTVKGGGTIESLSCPECGKYYGIPESGYTPKYCRKCQGVELKISVDEAKSVE